MPGEITFDGRPIPVEPGQTIAAALIAAGVNAWRTTRHQAAPRGLFCGIGVCFDCLVTVNGERSVRACLTEARPGDQVSTVNTASNVGAPPAPVVDTVTADVAVIGAGPAGLAAAATAARAGQRVVLVDGGQRIGGQRWRHRPGEPASGVFAELSGALTGVVQLTGEPVWFVEPGFALHVGRGVVHARQLVIATGAYDRTVPFPGWQLPGVVTAGGAQALLKGSGVPIGQRVVVAGAGPFLLPVAVGLAEAGATVVAVCEAGDPLRFVRHPRSVLRNAGKLAEGAGYAVALARRGIAYHRRTVVVEAHGDAGVTAVTVARAGRSRRLDCDSLAVSYGFTPQLELAVALGCATRLDGDGSLVVAVDAAQQTSVPGVYAAGEVTGVGGADLAVVEGRLAGLAATGGTPPAALLRRRSALRAFAAAMHAAHPVPDGWTERLDPTTLVCRCEEVPAGRITAAVRELGATDARTVKLVARPGMGWCQGRVCGYATAGLVAKLTGRDVSDTDLVPFATRPIAQPVRLADLGGAQQ